MKIIRQLRSRRNRPMLFNKLRQKNHSPNINYKVLTWMWSNMSTSLKWMFLGSLALTLLASVVDLLQTAVMVDSLKASTPQVILMSFLLILGFEALLWLLGGTAYLLSTRANREVPLKFRKNFLDYFLSWTMIQLLDHQEEVEGYLDEVSRVMSMLTYLSRLGETVVSIISSIILLGMLGGWIMGGQR